MSKLSIIFSTTGTLEGFEIVEYIGVETTEVVIGTGPISEMFSKMADTLGVRSKAFESKLDKGRKEAFKLLEDKAVRQGANAVIGLDIDIMAYEKNRTGMIVTATLVKVEKVVKQLKPEVPAVYYKDAVNHPQPTEQEQRTQTEQVIPVPIEPSSPRSSFSKKDILDKANSSPNKKTLDLSQRNISDVFEESPPSDAPVKASIGSALVTPSK